MDTAPQIRPSLAQRLVGLFVVGQLVFLVYGNALGLPLYGRFLGLSPNPPEAPWDLADAPTVTDPDTSIVHISPPVARLAAPSCRWGELTGQWQGWSLFAPSVPSQGAFLELTLSWDGPLGPDGEATVTLHDPFEPADLTHFVRLTGTNMRAFNYNWRLGSPLLNWGMLDQLEMTFWRLGLHDFLRRQHRPTLAYLRWRLRQFQEQHPGVPLPEQVVLSERLERPPPPQSGPVAAPTAVVQPWVRWHPGQPARPGSLDLEMFDPVTQRFEPVSPFAD